MVNCPSAIGEFILRPLSLRVRWNKRLVTALYLGKVGYHGIDEPPVARYENLWTGYCGITHYTDTVAEWLEGNDLRVWEPDTFSRTSEKMFLFITNPHPLSIWTRSVFNSLTLGGTGALQ